MQCFRQGPQTVGVACALEGVARHSLLQAQPERAARLYTWADTLCEAGHMLRPPIEQDAVDHDIVTIRRLLDEEALSGCSGYSNA